MIKNILRERGNPLFRFLDRYMGIPLIFFLGLFKIKRKTPSFTKESPLSIGVLLTSGIGDTVLFSGVIQDLRKSYPEATITLFSGSSNFEMAQLLPVQAVKLPLKKAFASIALIRRKEFDLWLDGNPWPRINSLFSFFSKARFKIGFQTSKQCRHYVYDKAVLHRTNCHEIENYRNLIRDFTGSSHSRPSIALPEKKIIEKQCVLHLFPGGSRAYLKEWPENYWIELINHLTCQSYCCHLTGSSADRPRLEKIIPYLHHPSLVKVVANQLNLKETAELLKTSVFTISVDTGIMHLAGALNCIVISLHGPTSFYRWGALGDSVYPLSPQEKYIPCIQLGFENCCKSNSCMQKISVEKVKEQINKVVDSHKRPKNKTKKSYASVSILK